MAATFAPLVVPIGSKEVDEFYPNILYSYFSVPDNKQDNVLVAVARMMLTEERAKEKTQYASYTNCTSMLIDGKLSKENVLGDGTVFKIWKQGIYFTFLYNESADDEIPQIKTFDAEYEKLGWKSLPDLARYIDNTSKTLVYQNEKRHGTAIITKASNAVKIIHMATSAFTRLMPWYFDKVPPTPDELKLLRALYSGDNATFTELAQQFYNAQGFRTRHLQKMLAGFCKVNYADRIKELENEIQGQQKDITNYYRRIREKQEAIEHTQIEIMVYQNKCTDGKKLEDDFLQFIKSNNAVTILKRDNDYNFLRIGITCNVDDYDETVFHTYVENPKANNYIYEASPYDRDVTRRFLMAVWKEHRWGLRSYCEWKLYDNCRYEAVSDSNMGGNRDLKENRVPQYHIDTYQCYGGWEAAMNECAKVRDYEGLVNLMVASSHSINWGDSCVVKRFMDKIWDDQDKKYFEDRDGKLWSAKEIITQLQNETPKDSAEHPTRKKRERPATPAVEGATPQF